MRTITENCSSVNLYKYCELSDKSKEKVKILEKTMRIESDSDYKNSNLTEIINNTIVADFPQSELLVGYNISDSKNIEFWVTGNISIMDIKENEIANVNNEFMDLFIESDVWLQIFYEDNKMKIKPSNYIFEEEKEKKQIEQIINDVFQHIKSFCEKYEKEAYDYYYNITEEMLVEKYEVDEFYENGDVYCTSFIDE